MTICGFLQTGYSVVAACVVTLRWNDKTASQVSTRWTSAWQEGVIGLLIIAGCGFSAGLLYRMDASLFYLLVPAVIAIFASIALYIRQVSIGPDNIWEYFCVHLSLEHETIIVTGAGGKICILKWSMLKNMESLTIYEWPELIVRVFCEILKTIKFLT